MILAGDIGGTNTRLALIEREPSGGLRIAVERVYPSKRYSGLDEIALQFLSSQHARADAACFGTAGPVKNGRCATMNLTWIVDQRQLAESLRIERVAVINDLAANAYRIACLGSGDINTVNAGAPGAAGHCVVVSPGTGLGEAGMFWDGRRYHPIPTEGGHTDFGPRNKLEVELAEFLMKEHEHLSYERIVSGPGLVNIYRFLRDTRRGEEPTWLADELKKSDPAAVISSAAMSGRSPLCEQALDVFIELFGAEAGNMALKYMALGGVWLGGGIVVKILSRLKATGLFMSGFTSKGRLAETMKEIPVRAILNDKTALLGAAQHAFDLLSA
jgi:glucokinase